MSQTEDITKDLKPCPFCGGKDLSPVFDCRSEAIECRRCGAVGPDSEKVDWDWNTRPVEAELRAEMLYRVSW